MTSSKKNQTKRPCGTIAPPVEATLDLDPQQFQAALREAAEFAGQYFKSVDEWRVFPEVDGKRLRRRIREPLPAQPEKPLDIVHDFEERIFQGCRHNLHSRFYGYVSSSGNPMGVLADMLTSTINQNVTSWRSAPAAVETELLVTDWIKKIIGYPLSSIGMLTSGGSMAMLQALAIAREIRSGGKVSGGGVQAMGKRRMIIYMSTQGHMSIPKSAALLGVGKNFVRMVKVNPDFTMNLTHLREQIRLDKKAGCLPLAVVASAGTVNTGAIDDLTGVARICESEELWFHVDGAYGGFAALAIPIRKRFRGIERADSVSLDPHKWLYQPLDCGCLLVRNREDAYRTFSGSADYAKVIAGRPGEDFVFFDHGMELSRRFRALKIWMTLKCYGTGLLAGCVEKNLAMAQELKTLIERKPRLELLAPVELSIVCFRYVPPSIQKELQTAAPGLKIQLEAKVNALNQSIMGKVQRRGKAYVSNAVLNGQFALRACIVSYRTEARDIKMLVDEVEEVGRNEEKRLA